jgi:hypothetical protein
METIKRFENYPLWIVVLSNFVSIAVYSLGFLIILKSDMVYAFFYLLYVLILELNLIKNHCTGCFYWGKTCGFGKGRISALFFKKGDPSKFCNNSFTWKDMIPDLLVALIPLVTGVVLLITDFNLLLLSGVLLLILLSTSGNGFIRGKLTCRYCKQSELGCPAQLLFNKEK